MDKRIMRATAVVIGLLLLGSIANSIYHSGWNQGYLMGIIASGEDGSQLLAPYYAYGRHGVASGVFGFFGAIFRFGFFALLFAALFKGLRCLKSRHNGSHRGEWGGPPWSKHWQNEQHDDRHDDQEPLREDAPRQEGGSGGPTPAGRIYWA